MSLFQYEWYKQDEDKPLMYNYTKATDTYSRSTSGFFTWQTRALWGRLEAAIKVKYIGQQPMKFNTISVKSLSGNSGNSGYWSNTGYISTPCKGYGGQYYVYIRKFTEADGIITLGESSNRTTYKTVPNQPYNMISAGSSTSDTAVFGSRQLQDLPSTTYEIVDCPVINNGDWFFINFGMYSFASGSNDDNTTINVSLRAGDIESEVKPQEDTPCIWRFSEDGKWHLVKRLYQYNNGDWQSLDS